jgi:hypothetical protein
MRLMVLGGVLGYVASMFVIATLGPQWGCGVIVATFAAAWVGHTERSRWMVGRLLDLAEQHFGSAKAAADHCGVPLPRWSKWRSGEEQASLSRLCELPERVWDTWRAESIESRGGVVIGSGRVADMTQAVRALEAAVKAHGAFTIPRQGAA